MAERQAIWGKKGGNPTIHQSHTGWVSRRRGAFHCAQAKRSRPFSSPCIEPSRRRRIYLCVKCVCITMTKCKSTAKRTGLVIDAIFEKKSLQSKKSM